MTTFDDFQLRPSDDFLSPPPVMPDDALRNKLRAETSRAIARKHGRRRLTTVVACGVCYAAGVASVALPISMRSRDAAAPIIASSPVETNIKQAAEPAIPPALTKEPPTKDDQPVAKTPRKRLTRFESLVQLGDTYLEDRKDPAKAVSYYEMALKHATPEEWEQAAVEGTWLLASVTNDRMREKVYAR